MRLFFLKLLSPILLLLFTVSCDELNQNAFSSILDPAFVSINSLRPKFIMNVQPNLPIQGDCKAITGGVQIIGNKKTLIEVPCIENTFRATIPSSDLSVGFWKFRAEVMDYPKKNGDLKKAYSRTYQVEIEQDTTPPTINIISPLIGTSINTTNESSLLVSGTCSESGRTVTLSHGTGSLTCNSRGFSGNIDFSSLADGIISLTASQTDLAGNTGTSSPVTLTKDTTPPTVNITSPVTGTEINTTNASSFLVSGTCSEGGGGRVTLSHGAGSLTCNSGNFSGNIDFSAVSDGSFSLTASQTDLAGNTGTSSAVNLTKDTGLPTVTITSPVTGTSINTANESSLLVSGTCSESGRTVSLSHGSGSLTCNSGTFSGNIDFSAVSDGNFSLTASQTDSLGNIGTSSSINLTKDTGLPTVAITSPVNGTSINTTNESSLLVSGTCSESGRTVSLSHGVGSLICNSSNSFSGNINFSAVSDGSFSLTASQTDASNNTGTSSAVNLTKDTGLPTVTIISPVTGSSINTTNESSLLVNGTCSESGRAVTLSQGLGALNCNSGNFSGNINFSAVSDGTFSLTASQTDASDNTGTSSAVNLTKDTGLPTVTITSPVTGTSINTANESSLLVSGTCSESGRTVSLSHGSGSLTCNSSNSFSGNINFSAVSDGTFSLTASQTDASNNTGTSSAVNLTKDTGLPIVAIANPVTGTAINTTNESSLLVSGTCSESGRAVTLSQGLGTLNCNSGNFSGNIDFSAVSDGTFSLTASQTDASNNTATSSAVNLTKDTGLPTVTITNPVTGTSINTTNESSLLVSGTCSESGRTVSLSHGTGPLTCNSSNNFSGNIDFSAVSDGAFSLTASQTDASNNTATSSAVSLTKDTGLPTVTITSPSSGSSINTANESSLLVSGTCSESGRTVSLSHGSGSLTCNGGNFSGNIDFSSLSDGSFSLTASQTDASNNTGTSSAVNLTKDTGLPTVTITSPSTGSSINAANESSLLVSGTCSESGRAVTLSQGLGALNCNSGNFSGNINFSSLSDGGFSLTASQTDSLGNIGTSSAVNLTKDTGLPTVTITNPVTGTSINTTNESSLLVSGTCSETGRTVSLSHGTGSLTCNGGNFSGNINFSSLSDGSFSLTASQTDSLGNIGTSSAVNLTKDTGLPTVTITSPVTGTSINTTNESSLSVSGTCSESGRTVSLSHGTGSLTCNGGNFSGNIDFSSLSDGTFSLTASQTDASGNTGTSSAVNLTKDTGLPTVTITSPVTGTSINTANESSLLVSGTCSESGRTVSLSHGTGSLTCNGGNFSGNIDFSSLSDGTFSLTASQTDASNNTATSSAVSLTKDTGLPTVTITSPSSGSSINTANESSLLVSGTCSESGRTVSLSHGSGSLTCNGGNFSGNIDFSAVSDGSFSLTASQTDASNNTATSSAVSLTKDTGLPTVTITSPVTGTAINTTNESSLLVSGTCSESGRAVSLSHGVGSLTCNGGNFSGNIDFSSLSDVTFSLTASQTDASNNTATSNAVSLTKDTGLPTVSITSPVTGTSINTANESSLLVSGTCSENGRTVSLSHGTGSLTCNGGNFSGNINFSTVSDGTFSLTASQTDASNNTATSSAVSLTKDTGLPIVAITSPSTGSSINTANESSLLVSGTCSESGRAVTLSHGSGSLTCNGGNFSGNIDFSAVADGSFSLTASQTDASNNTATSSAVNLTKDTGLPIVAITSPSTGSSINTANESSLLVSGTCSESGQAVTLSHGSGSLTCNGGNFSGNIDFSAVADGSFSLTASQTDASNNTATSSAVNLTKDTGLPTITITNPVTGTSINAANESSLLVSGTCSESGRAVTLSHGSGSLTCNGGNFSGSINFSTVSDGSFSLTASQTDASNNTATSSAVSLTKDTGLPTVTITSPVTGTSINTANESSLLVSGTCSESGRAVTLSHGSGSLTCNSGTFSGNINFSTVSDGTFSLTASQTDASNNTGTSSAVNLTKDTGLPTVTITSPSSGSSINTANESSLLVSGTCSESGRSVTLSHSTGSLTCNGGNFSGNIDFSSLSDGDVSLTASQTDAFGNTGVSSAVTLTKSTGRPMISVWRTLTNNEEVELPLKRWFSYNFRVNWGDGSPESIVTSFNDTDKAHTYVTSGDYTITITGLVEAWGSSSSSIPYQNQIIEVSDLGEMGWKNLSYAFYRCTNLTAVSGGDTSKVTHMNSMFREATSANPDVRNWDTSKVTNMSFMFHEATSANPDVRNWDTSKVTDMNNMFRNATSANPDVSNWDTSKVTHMNSMFLSATSANPDVRNWDTSKVTDMSFMFHEATSANPDVNSWDTSKVTNMSFMFHEATSANPDVSNWDTSKVTHMHNMFYGATSANPDVRNWNTSKVTSMSRMFSNATSANPDVSNWDTSKVIGMNSMFSDAIAANPDTRNWDTSKVTFMISMFFGATSANPDVSNWDTSKVTRMDTMFHEATSANPDVSSWDTSKVTNMHGMFSDAIAANPDTRNWDTSKVTDMTSMFSGATVANPNVSNWDTSMVTRMDAMFSGATVANPDVSNWDTSKVTNMSNMFWYATSANPDVRNWDTSKVTNMHNMFFEATSANPDLRNFDFTSLRTTGTSSSLFGNLISFSGISTLNYSNLLINLDSQVIHESVITRAGQPLVSPAQYNSSAAAARARLVSDGWVIRDGGLESP